MNQDSKKISAFGVPSAGNEGQDPAARTLPAPAAVKLMAGAITGSAVEPLVGWYPMSDRKLMDSGKIGGSQSVPWHPDKRAEACAGRPAKARSCKASG